MTLATTSSTPVTFRKVSCWPAKLASGRSSAVADERTATETSDAPAFCTEFAIGLADRFIECRLQRGIHDPLADFLADRHQGRHIVHVQSVQTVVNALGQVVEGDEFGEGVGRGGEAARHRNAELAEVSDHFAEARSFYRRPGPDRKDAGDPAKEPEYSKERSEMREFKPDDYTRMQSYSSAFSRRPRNSGTMKAISRRFHASSILRFRRHRHHRRNHRP